MANSITFESPNLANLQEKNSKNNMKKYLIILCVLLLVAISGALAYYFIYYQNKQLNLAKIEEQQKVLAEESKKYMDELKSVMLIEGDESPVIAKVSDAEKLKLTNPEFYKNLQVGDIVYIYSYRIIVFRPSEKKIINIAPIINTKNLENSTSSIKTQ